MGSIRLVYDSEGDILDVDFRLAGEKPERGIELHDNVTVWTDAQGTRILHLMLLSYSKLLEQPALTIHRGGRSAETDAPRRPGDDSGILWTRFG